jgi:hypothetical protein
VDVSGGLPAVRMGDRVLLRPGTYRVRAEHAGYKPARDADQGDEGAEPVVPLTLVKLPGILRIDVPAAARVTWTTRKPATRPANSS